MMNEQKDLEIMVGQTPILADGFITYGGIPEYLAIHEGHLYIQRDAKTRKYDLLKRDFMKEERTNE